MRNTSPLSHHVTSWAVVLVVQVVVGWTVSQINLVSPSRKGPPRPLALHSFFFLCVSSEIASVACACQPSLGTQKPQNFSCRACCASRSRPPLSPASTATTVLYKGGFKHNGADLFNCCCLFPFQNVTAQITHPHPRRATGPPTPTCQGPSPVPGPKVTTPLNPMFCPTFVLYLLRYFARSSTKLFPHTLTTPYIHFSS